MSGGFGSPKRNKVKLCVKVFTENKKINWFTTHVFMVKGYTLGELHMKLEKKFGRNNLYWDEKTVRVLK